MEHLKLVINKTVNTNDKKIPKKIYYTSFDNKIPENTESYKLIKKNSEIIPYYQIFDNKEARDFIKEHFVSDVLIYYDQLIPASFRSDFFRTCVMYIHGGIYLDLGIEMTRNILDILDIYDLILIKGITTKNAIAYGIICSYPNNLFFLKCLDKMCNNIKTLNKTFSSLSITGPILVGPILKTYYLINNLENKNYKKKDNILLLKWQYKNFIHEKKVFFITNKNETYRKEMRKISSLPHYSRMWKNNNVFKISQSSWIKSSRNYKIEDGYLICECKNIKGQYVKNKIKLREDNYKIVNKNGILLYI